MKTIAVGSGKGGVGKTTLTSNISVAAAKRGLRVLALDADYGLANLHLHLGLYGSLNVEDVLLGKCPLEKALQKHSSGLHLLAGASGSTTMANLTPEMAKNAISQFDHLEQMTDVLFIDVAAGIHAAALDTLAAADIALIVVTPDPSSFIDAFATVKLLQRYPDHGQINIVINQADSETNAKLLFARFQSVVKEHTGLTIRYQGYIPREQGLVRTGTQKEPIVLAQPNSQSSKLVYHMAEDLFGLTARGPVQQGSFLSRFFSRNASNARVA